MVKYRRLFLSFCEVRVRLPNKPFLPHMILPYLNHKSVNDTIVSVHPAILNHHPPDAIFCLAFKQQLLLNLHVCSKLMCSTQLRYNSALYRHGPFQSQEASSCFARYKTNSRNSRENQNYFVFFFFRL